MDRSNGSIVGPTNTPTPTAAGGYWSLVEEYQAQRNGNWIAPGYNISRSLRFNSADSAYLNRTPGSAGNRKTWTWSGWVKRSALANANLFNVETVNGGTYTDVKLINDKLFLDSYGPTGDLQARCVTDGVFRDVAAWYHIVAVLNTPSSTAADRAILYVNGVRISQSITDGFDQNADLMINTTNEHRIGTDVLGNENYLSGYLTEVNFIDGQALTPASFGVTDTVTGVWRPIQYTGSYGTNGFYLNFSDNSGTTSTTLGKDSSPNNNNWTPNNFSVTAGAGNDSLTDTPTPYGTDTGAGGEVRGNYATLNPLKVNTAADNQFSNGNLNYTVGAYDVSVVSTIGVSTGKWYWEVKWTQDSGYDRPGIVPEDAPANQTPTANGIIWNRLSTSNGMVMLGNNVSGSWGNAFAVNDIIMFALDCDNKALYIGQNGTWRNSGSPTSGSSKTGAVDYGSTSLATKTLLPVFGKGNVGTTSWEANFGQRPFAYTAPSGFKALCTQNLPTPTIGATATTRADDYFNTVLYTGNGSAPRTITGVGFQPDFVWVKSRSNTYAHFLWDAVRGTNLNLFSNLTNAEANVSSGSTDGGVSTSASDGFTLTAGTGSSNNVNNNGSTYVGWNWKANGVGSSNTAGTITSTVSANTTAGFSVVTYTGTGSGTPTVGHGLGVAPSMIFVKSRSNAVNWGVGHTSAGWANAGLLNDTNAFGASTYFASTAPTSTVFSIQDNTVTNISGATYVAYCFAAVAGYSAFGSYTGNGSSDGPFVYTGFRPRMIIFKRSSGSGNDWRIIDTSRSPYNQGDQALYPNSTTAEAGNANDAFDILSNGFKQRGTAQASNDNGSTYIYAAFAEFPFKYALAR